MPVKENPRMELKVMRHLGGRHHSMQVVEYIQSENREYIVMEYKERK